MRIQPPPPTFGLDYYINCKEGEMLYKKIKMKKNIYIMDFDLEG